MPRSASARVAAKPGSASGASVTSGRDRGTDRSSSRSQSRSTGRTRSTGCAPGRAAEERAFEVHADDRLGRAPLRCGEPLEHRVVRVERRGADVGSNVAAPRSTTASTASTISSTRRRREVDRTDPVDLEVDEAGASSSPERSCRSACGGGRPSRPRRCDPLRPRPMRATPRAAVAGDDTVGDEERHASAAVAPEHDRSFTSRDDRAGHAPEDRAARRATLDDRRPGSRPSASRTFGAQDQFGVEEVLPELAHTRDTARPRRAASPSCRACRRPSDRTARARRCEGCGDELP